MEQVIEVYTQPKNEDEPLICMDEACKELHGQVQPPLPMRPATAGHPATPAREDDKYQRNGVMPLFMFFAPLLGWRRASVCEHRTGRDWAQQIRQLLTEDFPNARRITLVCDNLNTHHIAWLYATFPPHEALALARRLNIVHTPRNGSWLNVAEIELSVLSRQCLNRRIEDASMLRQEVAVWSRQRNEEASVLRWQFTTADARVKLHHLYPQL